jgi:pilus assembly protein CpaE
MNLNVTGYLVHKHTCDEVEAALQSINNIVLSMHLQEGEWSLKSVGKEEIPDIIIYELGEHREEDIQELENILKEFPNQVTVLVTHKDGDMETMRRLMRAGVRDAFPRPIQTQELVDTVINILSEKRARLGRAKGGKGCITAFVSAKGGSGATTVATNVAEILAHSFESKVLLIDLDIQYGDAALLLDLVPSKNVMEALLQPQRIDPVFLKALILKHDSGLDLLASPADLSSLGGIAPEGIAHIIDAASELYDFVIIDVPRVLTSWTMKALRYSDPVVLVGQNNISSIRDTKLLLDRLVHEGFPADNIEVINNRAMAKQGSVPIDKMKETLGIKRIHKVSNDYKTSVNSQSQGQPIQEVSKGSDFTKDLTTLADYLYVLQKGEHKKKGLFSRLFS